MIVDKNTKIGDLLKMRKDALDIIASIAPAFEKLKNPVLRKSIAPRVRVKDAARIGNLTVNEFLNALAKHGFEVRTDDRETVEVQPKKCEQLKNYKIVSFDVRPLLEKGQDPFNNIREKLTALNPGEALEVILDFEPVPLIDLFEKSGYDHCTKCEDDHVSTYFFKPLPSKGGFWSKLKSAFQSGGRKNKEAEPLVEVEIDDAGEFERLLKEYEGKLKKIDVRGMEMPMPMMTILEELSKLSGGEALLVEHERIPQYLLPELKKRNRKIAVKKIEDSHTQLIIY